MEISNWHDLEGNLVLVNSQKAGISRATLSQVEKGVPSVSVGAYFQVLFALGLENGFLRLGADDELDRKLQDAGLTTKKRAPKKIGVGGNNSQTAALDRGL